MGIITVIAAVAQNGVIGFEGTLPWRLSGDMTWFKKNTVGKKVVMGGRTFASLAKPLPDRENWVLTHFPKPDPRVHYVTSFEELEQAMARSSGDEEWVIIGGASLYRHFLPKAQRFYWTEVLGTPDGDVFFPSWQVTDWEVTFDAAFSCDEKNNYPYVLRILERKA